jgi:hypothetical protein
MHEELKEVAKHDKSLYTKRLPSYNRACEWLNKMKAMFHAPLELRAKNNELGKSCANILDMLEERLGVEQETPTPAPAAAKKDSPSSSGRASTGSDSSDDSKSSLSSDEKKSTPPRSPQPQITGQNYTVSSTAQLHGTLKGKSTEEKPAFSPAASSASPQPKISSYGSGSGAGKSPLASLSATNTSRGNQQPLSERPASQNDQGIQQKQQQCRVM